MREHTLGARQRELLKALGQGPLRVTRWNQDLEARLLELGLVRRGVGAELELTRLGVEAVRDVHQGRERVRVAEPPPKPELRSARSGAQVRR